MPGAVRLGDLCTGHTCWPPRPNNTASKDVFIDGIATHRQGDHWLVHCCDGSCHDGVSSQGSPTVFANGKSVFRKGDPVNCGSHGDECSQTVFCDDTGDLTPFQFTY